MPDNNKTSAEAQEQFKSLCESFSETIADIIRSETENRRRIDKEAAAIDLIIAERIAASQEKAKQTKLQAEALASELDRLIDELNKHNM